MNSKRVVIATVIGILCGLFCAYGTEMKFPGQFSVLVLAGIVYNRALIGFVIGIADHIKLNPILRGAVIGAVVTGAMAIYSAEGSLILIAFGIVYGIITDVIATKYSQKKEEKDKKS